MEKRPLFQITHSEDFKYLRTARGIVYFEGGWWMHEGDRHEMNSRLGGPLKADKETKQITIDYTIYP